MIDRRAGWLAAALVAGALARALLLPLEGSVDVGSWKAWSFSGSYDATALYGVGGHPPERRLLPWQGGGTTTEYPPLALYEISAMGRIYRSIDHSFSDSPLLTVLIKTPGIVAEIVLVIFLLTSGRRLVGPGARWLAVAFWLNPAVILNGAALGYLDAQMAVPATIALVMACAGRPGVAGALLAIAVMTKAQALFVGPVVLLAVIRARRGAMARAFASFALAGAGVVVGLVVPVVLRGAWPNMVQAVGRLAAHDMVSGYGLNVWWIVTWLVRAQYSMDLGLVGALTAPVKILQITRFVEVGYPNPKPLGSAIVVALLVWGIWRWRRGTTPAGWAGLAGWSVFAYAMFSAQVHENHLYLAVPMFALAAAWDPSWRAIFYAVSLTTAFNMYIFYGLSGGWPPVIDRTWTGVDMSVLVAFANVALFGWVTKKAFTTKITKA